MYEIHFTSDKMTFWETKEYCDDLGDGWQLPTPTNSKENKAALKIAKKIGNIYLGVSQYRNQFVNISEEWFNVYTEEEADYSNWMKGQPNNYKGNEDYVVMLG